MLPNPRRALAVSTLATLGAVAGLPALAQAAVGSRARRPPARARGGQGARGDRGAAPPAPEPRALQPRGRDRQARGGGAARARLRRGAHRHRPPRRRRGAARRPPGAGGGGARRHGRPAGDRADRLPVQVDGAHRVPGAGGRGGARLRARHPHLGAARRRGDAGRGPRRAAGHGALRLPARRGGRPAGREGGRAADARGGGLRRPAAGRDVRAPHPARCSTPARWRSPRGPIMAAADRFHVTIRGKQSHGAYPHLGVDPVVTAAQAILALQTISSRTVAADRRLGGVGRHRARRRALQHHPRRGLPRGHGAHLRRRGPGHDRAADGGGRWPA